jgi:hypothetical protein
MFGRTFLSIEYARQEWNACYTNSCLVLKWLLNMRWALKLPPEHLLEIFFTILVPPFCCSLYLGYALLWPVAKFEYWFMRMRIGVVQALRVSITMINLSRIYTAKRPVFLGRRTSITWQFFPLYIPESIFTGLAVPQTYRHQSFYQLNYTGNIKCVLVVIIRNITWLSSVDVPTFQRKLLFSSLLW